MEDIIFNAILGPLKAEEIELVEVKYGKEDGVNTLFVTIDSEEAVDTDMCVRATEIINPIVDVLDLIKEEYVLDVGSKGVKE